MKKNNLKKIIGKTILVVMIIAVLSIGLYFLVEEKRAKEFRECMRGIPRLGGNQEQIKQWEEKRREICGNKDLKKFFLPF